MYWTKLVCSGQLLCSLCIHFLFASSVILIMKKNLKQYKELPKIFMVVNPVSFKSSTTLLIIEVIGEKVQKCI